MTFKILTTEEDCLNLIELSKELDFSCKLDYELAKVYCTRNSVETYGIYEDDKLVSIMTATFCRVFPCQDSPTGKVIQISGAYTHPDYRHKGYASYILNYIEKIGRLYNNDYLCCDSIADKLYINNDFIKAPKNESRLWKSLRKDS